ncbi:phage tail protein [Hymenobacter koreensis]|uniref:Tail fiber protein n=1 Tax=Hymenobacter koreensis TaxID=1084523 RepID=A0ABP8JMB7_9BACT
MEPYLGEIRIFGGNFAPLGWLYCQGQLLSISEYDSLYALIGTTYGGDGQTTFALPNLSSRVVVGQGQLPGGSNYLMAQQLGVENVTLNGTQLPAHAHPFTGTIGVVTSSDRDQPNPTGATFGSNGTSAYSAGLGDKPGTLGAGSVTGQASVVGAGQPHPNIQPVLATSYIICTSGIWPSQS